jgi:hypothetical protein
MSVTINGTSGVTFNDASLQTTAATGFGFKNRIINGAMVIDQRNAGASVTQTTADLFPVDRWIISGTVTSKFTGQQNAGSVTPPAGFVNYLGITSSSAYTVGAAEQFYIRQKIEGFNVADFGWGSANASTVTLSFWVRSSLTGTFGGSLLNSAQDRSYPFTYTISVANTWEQKTITVAGDTSGTWLTTNGVGLFVFLGLGVGSTLSGTAGAWAAAGYFSATGATSVVGTNGATFYITGVQLEKGSTATSFDYRPYGTELALCQRYAWSTFPSGTSWGQNKGATDALEFVGLVLNALHATPLKMPVTMRTTPTTITTYSPNAASANWGTNTNTPIASLGQTGQELISLRGASPVSVGSAYQIHVSVEAEL